MKLTTNYAPIYAHVADSFEAAVEDTLEVAKGLARVRTGKYRGSLRRTETRVEGSRLSARIGSPLSSAGVKEKGGFIRAKRHSTLFIPMPDGSVRRPQAVRIPATPTVVPAGRRFPSLMRHHLGRGFSGRGSVSRGPRVDFRSGSVQV